MPNIKYQRDKNAHWNNVFMITGGIDWGIGLMYNAGKEKNEGETVMETKIYEIGSASGKQIIVHKATGIQFTCNDCEGVIRWIKTNVQETKDYADVRVKLDDVELTFTLDDFKKRLGFR